MPPEDIWHHHKRIEEWFAAVKQRRDSGMQPLDAEDEHMTGNALLGELIGD